MKEIALIWFRSLSVGRFLSPFVFEYNDEIILKE